MLDCTYRVQISHRLGMLATVAGVISEHGGLIGDVLTVSTGYEHSLREITVEVRDSDQAEAIFAAIDSLDGVHVEFHQDRALLRHEGGKLQIEPIQRIRTVQEMRDVYTPGVARVCQAIAREPGLARRYTMIARSVAICTNGTRVLGLGNIGPVASMPVMEGKSVFYNQFAGISAMPILIDSTDVDSFVETVIRIAPTFGGIHLEDISTPDCFEIEARLIEALPQPVMHDDVHGTAVVTGAAMIVACRRAGVTYEAATVGQLGLGAAGYGIAALAVQSGASRVIAFDPQPGSHARAQAAGIEIASMEEVMAQADVVVATTGRPGLITPQMIRPGQVILALTNPDPEITPDAAEAAGAAFAADGRSVNNVIGYPGIFRGALQAGARRIDLEMKLAAMRAIVEVTGADELVPDALDARVHDAVAAAVRDAAYRSGSARPELASVSL